MPKSPNDGVFGGGGERGRVWRNYALKKNFSKSLMILVFVFDLRLHHRLALGKSLCTGKSGVAPSNFYVGKNEKWKIVCV